MAKKVLLTGATGFIGRRLLTRLLEKGHQVRAVSRRPPAALDLPAHPNLELYQGDALDASALPEMLEGMDAAINLREINTLLKQEQSKSGESPLVEEFILIHARAADVLSEIETLLGLQTKQAPEVPMSSSQIRAMQQQQLAQQMAARGGR